MEHTQPEPSSDASSPIPSSPVPTDWFRTAFGGDYLRVYRRRNEAAGLQEAAFARRHLDLSAEDRVLDLACGAGRHSAPLAAEGLAVVSFDLSAPLLAEAAERLGDRARLVRGDMRVLPFATGSFDAITSFFTSFGYFSTPGDDARVLAEMARVVRREGQLLLELPDRETTVNGLVPASEREEEGRRIAERRWITADGARVEKEIVVTELSSGRSERNFESVRLYSASEIERLATAAGWRLAEWVGDFEGAVWSAGESPRMIGRWERVE